MQCNSFFVKAEKIMSKLQLNYILDENIKHGYLKCEKNLFFYAAHFLFVRNHFEEIYGSCINAIHQAII